MNLIRKFFLRDLERRERILTFRKMVSKAQRRSLPPIPDFTAPLNKNEEKVQILNQFGCQNNQEDSKSNQLNLIVDYEECFDSADSKSTTAHSDPLIVASFCPVENTSKQIEIISTLSENIQERIESSFHYEEKQVKFISKRSESRERSRSPKIKKNQKKSEEKVKSVKSNYLSEGKESKSMSEKILINQMLSSSYSTPEKKRFTKIYQSCLNLLQVISSMFPQLKEHSKQQIIKSIQLVASQLSLDQSFFKNKQISSIAASVLIVSSRRANHPFGLRAIQQATTFQERHLQKITESISQSLEISTSTFPDHLFDDYVSKILQCSSNLTPFLKDQNKNKILAAVNYIYQNTQIHGLIQGQKSEVAVGAMVMLATGLNINSVNFKQFSILIKQPELELLEHSKFLMSHSNLLLNNSSLFSLPIEYLNNQLNQN